MIWVSVVYREGYIILVLRWGFFYGWGVDGSVA